MAILILFLSSCVHINSEWIGYPIESFIYDTYDSEFADHSEVDAFTPFDEIERDVCFINYN